jgi:hypothetical protein
MLGNAARFITGKSNRIKPNQTSLRLFGTSDERGIGDRPALRVRPAPWFDGVGQTGGLGALPATLV